MARKGIASIGVDLGARELRAVEVSTDGRTIKHFAGYLLPSMGQEFGVPADANSLAEGLRGLFRDLNPGSRGVVFGIPAAAVTTRVLDIPQVPDSELKTILEGEIQHYGIVRGFGGMFDYMRIDKPGKTTEPQALVMACEAVQLNTIRDASERARLDKAGIEPTLLGLIRVAAAHHKTTHPVLLIAVSGDIAEIAVMSDHKIRLYRRLELALESAEDSFLRGMIAEPEDAVPAFLKAEAGSGVAHQLVVELKRTLDYVKREFDAGSAVEHVILAVSSPKEAPLADILSEGLEMSVEVAKAPLPGDDGFRYAAAYGLAIGNAFTSTGVPLFDLSPFDPIEEENQKQRKLLAGSLAASIILIVASAAAGLVFGRQASDIESQTASDKAELAKIQQVELPEAMRRQAKLEAYKSLSTFGVPVPQVVDSLTQVLDAKTGLNTIDINGSSIAMTGESASEASMINTLEQMRVQPGFRSAFIESFDQAADQSQKLVKFRMTAQLGGGPK